MTSTRRWLLLLASALAALSVALFLIVSSSDRSTEAGFSFDPPALAAEDSHAEPVIVAARPVEEQPTPERSVVQTRIGKEPANKKTRYETPPEDGLPVQIFDASGGAPSERATVYVVRYGTWEKKKRMRTKRLAKAGDRYLTDAEGRVRIKPFKGSFLIAAQTTGQWSWRRVDPAWDSVRLRLERFPDLELRVVDHTGAPAAEVALAIRPLTRSESIAYAEATTDADGLASFEDVLGILDAKAGKRKVAVAIDAPLAEAVEVVIDPAALPAGPLELALPPCGSVEVRVRQLDGAPWNLSPGYLRTKRTNEEGQAWESELRIESGRVRLPWVDLGSELEVRYTGRGGTSKKPFKVAGPTRTGQAVVALYKPTETMHVLVGRAVNDDRGPVGGRSVRLAITGGSRYESHRVKTQSDGRFRVRIDHHVGSRTLYFTASSSDPSLGAVVDLKQDTPLGETDLGDVHLQETKLLVAGTVRRDDGTPIRSARIAIDRKTGPGPKDWRLIRGATASTKKDGSFEIHSLSDEVEAVRVRAKRRGLVQADPPEFVAGTTGATVVLDRTGSMKVELLFDSMELCKDTTLRLSQGEKTWTRPSICRRPSRDRPLSATCKFDDLPLGLATLEVLLDTEPSALVVLDGIVISPGRAAEDPRLHPIDLRGLVSEIRIEVRGEEGITLPWSSASWSPTGLGVGPGGGSRVFGEDGELSILTNAPMIEATVSAVGYRTRTVQVTQGEHEVVLERALPVRLIVAGFRTLPEGVALTLCLSSAGASRATSSELLDESGEVLLLADGPGRHDVWCLVRRGSDLQALDDDPLEIITVVETEEEQVFRVDLDWAKVYEALGELEDAAKDTKR